MTQNTVVTYESTGGIVRFARNSDYWIETIRGLETSVKTETTQSVAQLGESLNAQIVQPKTLTITGTIVGDVQRNRAQLLAVILPLTAGRLTITEDGQSWYLDGVPTKTPIMSDGSVIQTYQFAFYVPYPYLRTTERVTYTLTGITPLWRTPFHTGGKHWISKFTEDMFERIKNVGNVAQAFTVDFFATSRVVNPILHNVDAGTVIRICKTMEAGERLRISTHQQDKDAGNAVLFFPASSAPENGFRYITAESDLDMQIPPGGCICMADADEYKSNLRCTLVTAAGERHSL